MERSFQHIVEQNVLPYVRNVIKQAASHKAAYKIDGVTCFNPSDFVIAGTIVQTCGQLARFIAPQDSHYPSFLHDVTELIEYTAHIHMETWGIYFYTLGLYHLDQQGILAQLPLQDTTKATLQKRLDWRTFVNEHDLSMPGFPTNYYGVAFRIALYRELLGWDEPGYSDKLLHILTEHFVRHSGDLLFMDETPGYGRYDSYSLVMPQEICLALLDANKPIPPMILDMLRKSANIYLHLANEQGHGFSYGRSIGMLGDSSAYLLALAAKLDVLYPTEKELAYAYTVRIAEKFHTFWLDPQMGSVNLWEHGRRTDPYRHKQRILEINLGISYKMIEAATLWQEQGFTSAPNPTTYTQQLSQLPQLTYFPYTQDPYSRGIAIFRDRTHVFSIPLTNVGEGSVTAYLPIPHESQVLEAPAYTTHPQLIPFIKLASGETLAPIAFSTHTQLTDNQQLHYKQAGLALLHDTFPPKLDQRIASQTTLHFQTGSIEREETLYPQQPLQVEEITLEFATFSEHPHIQNNRITFTAGPIQSFELTGLDNSHIELIPEQEAYHTPHGAQKVKLRWHKRNFSWHEPLTIRWRLDYQ